MSGQPQVVNTYSEHLIIPNGGSPESGNLPNLPTMQHHARKDRVWLVDSQGVRTTHGNPRRGCWLSTGSIRLDPYTIVHSRSHFGQNIPNFVGIQWICLKSQWMASPVIRWIYIIALLFIKSQTHFDHPLLLINCFLKSAGSRWLGKKLKNSANSTFISY